MAPSVSHWGFLASRGLLMLGHWLYSDLQLHTWRKSVWNWESRLRPRRGVGFGGHCCPQTHSLPVPVPSPPCPCCCRLLPISLPPPEFTYQVLWVPVGICWMCRASHLSLVVVTSPSMCSGMLLLGRKHLTQLESSICWSNVHQDWWLGHRIGPLITMPHYFRSCLIMFYFFLYICLYFCSCYRFLCF